MQEIKALEELEGSLQQRYDRIDAAIQYFTGKITPAKDPTRPVVMEAEVTDEAEVAHISEALITLKDEQHRIGVKIIFIREATGAILETLGHPGLYGKAQQARQPEEVPDAGAAETDERA